MLACFPIPIKLSTVSKTEIIILARFDLVLSPYNCFVSYSHITACMRLPWGTDKFLVELGNNLGDIRRLICTSAVKTAGVSATYLRLITDCSVI